MIRVGIIGGAGYTAGELIRLLVNHPQAEIAFVHSTSNAGNRLAQVHGGLEGDTGMRFCDAYDLGAIDVLFLCSAHGQSRVWMEENSIPAGVKIIDLAQDFRDESCGFVYGLPELNRERIRRAERVANPGCFATAIQLALLPLAAAGVDIEALVRGAEEMERATGEQVAFAENPAAVYATVRNALYEAGKKIEILGSYEPKLQYINEWWKQLYGESEGKDGKGLFPASVTLTADLHSMGQYIQEGERTMFETIVSVTAPKHEVRIESDAENLDGLNYLAGKRLSEVNRMAELGVQLAHVDGGVPNLRIEIPEISAHALGALLYFFEKACGISGYLLGVNPFNQPGVEAYKKNMFALLEKPGYEAETKAIRERLK